MKVVFALFFVVAVAMAAPPSPDADALVLKSESDVEPEKYNFAYETSNGIAADEQGELVNAGAENEAIAVRGSFKYTAPDGVVYSVNYVADENGFQPEGAHLPGAPQ